MKVVEDERYSRDYLDPQKRSIANAVMVYFGDGTSSTRTPSGSAPARGPFLLFPVLAGSTTIAPPLGQSVAQPLLHQRANLVPSP